MLRLWRHHGLSITLALLFLITWGGGQIYTGWREYNDERASRSDPPVALTAYLASPHFIEATSENWESEFFQMFVYVFITAFLFQKGSAESKNPDEPEPPEPALTKKSPWAARRGGWVRRIYSHSLSLGFATLFLISFCIHARSGTALYNEERVAEGESPVSTRQYLHTTRFWFESFQNWQSEFLAIGSMVALSIFLREKGSPESKPVNAPHSAHD